MITLYHGTRRDSFPHHAGLCLAEKASIARDYAGEDGIVYRVEIDDDMLSWERVDGYDRDTDTAPADRAPEALAAELGVCSVWYDDETVTGRRHDTLRLLTADALDAIVSVEMIG